MRSAPDSPTTHSHASPPPAASPASRAKLEAMLAPHLRGVPARIDVIAVDRIPRVHSGTLASEAR